MASLTRIQLVTAAVLAAMVSFSTATSRAQRQSQPAVGQPQSRQSDALAPDATSTDPGKPMLSEADRKIREAFLKTKSATTAEDCTVIITACQEGIDSGATAEGAAYARKLKAWAHNKRGEMLAEASKEKEALKDFDTAAALDPLLWKAVQNRGVSKAATGDVNGAFADFDRVIELNPDYANAWYNRAELKAGKGDFPGAAQDLSRAIRIKPDDAGFYNRRGDVLYQLGRQREALSDYNRAVQLNPNDAVALVNRGDTYRGQGAYGQAANDYREAIRLNGQLGRAYFSAAWLMATCPDARYRNAEKAIEAANRAIEIDGEKDYRYLDTLAAAHANAGQFTEAKQVAIRAMSAAPDKFRNNVEQRLKIYERNQAYREGGPAEPVRAATRTM